MPRYSGPTIGRRCPRPWTTADEQKLQQQLVLLKQDMAEAGGLEAWLEDRLPTWLAEAGPCPVKLSRQGVPHLV